jgi:hypothetical protein
MLNFHQIIIFIIGPNVLPVNRWHLGTVSSVCRGYQLLELNTMYGVKQFAFNFRGTRRHIQRVASGWQRSRVSYLVATLMKQRDAPFWTAYGASRLTAITFWMYWHGITSHCLTVRYEKVFLCSEALKKYH